MLMNELPAQLQEAAYKLMADEFEQHGLRLEDNFRISDEGLAFSRAAAKLVRRTGVKVSGNKTLKGMGIDRTNGFWHPLSESTSEADSGVPGGAMNLWASASLFVSVALGWTKSSDPSAAKGAVKDAVSTANPLIDVEALMHSARYHDGKLLKLVGLTQAGIEIKMTQAFEKLK